MFCFVVWLVIFGGGVVVFYDCFFYWMVVDVIKNFEKVLIFVKKCSSCNFFCWVVIIVFVVDFCKIFVFLDFFIVDMKWVFSICGGVIVFILFFIVSNDFIFFWVWFYIVLLYFG